MSRAGVANAKVTESQPYLALVLDGLEIAPLHGRLFLDVVPECLNDIGLGERQNEFVNVLLEMRQISYLARVKPSKNSPKIDDVALCDHVYSAELKLLSMSRSDSLVAESPMESYILRCCCCAASLYLYIVFRHVSITAASSRFAAKEIYRVMDDTNCLFEASLKAPTILLWWWVFPFMFTWFLTWLSQRAHVH